MVFGNEVLAGGAPSARLAARLDAAISARAHGLAPLILVSGGTGASGFNEADVMRDYLIHAGVPAGSVLADREGATTMATAAHAAEVMQERRLHSAMVVTQWFHVPRCLIALRRSGVTDATATYPAFLELRDVYSAARELVAIPFYAFRSVAPGDKRS